jgi:hypothetical protein
MIKIRTDPPPCVKPMIHERPPLATVAQFKAIANPLTIQQRTVEKFIDCDETKGNGAKG